MNIYEREYVLRKMAAEVLLYIDLEKLAAIGASPQGGALGGFKPSMRRHAPDVRANFRNVETNLENILKSHNITETKLKQYGVDIGEFAKMSPAQRNEVIKKIGELENVSQAATATAASASHGIHGTSGVRNTGSALKSVEEAKSAGRFGKYALPVGLGLAGAAALGGGAYAIHKYMQNKKMQEQGIGY